MLDRVESESNDKVQALLSVTVIDPACGSGHFLLAAARRIAARVARARTGGVASAQDYRHALRDVVRSCIHGVDRNPMAVELTKVALWIETVEPGKPLGFLDASILCGDSLLGVFDLEVLRQGIPDAAYKPLSGDDKDAAKYFDRRNKAERDGQGTLDFIGGKNSLPSAPPFSASLRAVRKLPEDTHRRNRRKEETPCLPPSPSVNYGAGASPLISTSRRFYCRRRMFLAIPEPRWCQPRTTFGGRFRVGKYMGHSLGQPARSRKKRECSTGRWNSRM